MADTNGVSRLPHSRPTAEFRGDLAKRITEARERAGMTRVQLAGILGISATAVGNWETARARPDLESLRSICNICKVSADELLDIEQAAKSSVSAVSDVYMKRIMSLDQRDRKLIDSMLDTIERNRYEEFKTYTYVNNFVQMRLSGLSACAGNGIDLEGGDEGTMIDIRINPETRRCDEIIRISGDSMKPTFRGGQRVLVQRTDSLDYGEIGIFIVNGEGMIKEYRKQGLHPHNPAYHDIKINPDDNVKCYGRVLCALTRDMLPTEEERIMIDEIRNEVTA